MENNSIKNIILGTGSYDTVKCGNTVSITEDGGNAWGYFGPSYKKLAPRLVTYLPYAEKLDYLNELKTGVYIPEVNTSQNAVVKKVDPIRYKNILKKYI